MTLNVMKFGGSSLGRAESLARALGLIREAAGAGPLVVVVSAFADTTDLLLDLAQARRSGRSVASAKIADRLIEAARDAAAALGIDFDARVVAPLLAELDALLRHGPDAGAPDAAFADEISAFGERLSSATVASLLQRAGTGAVAVDARDLVVTDATFGEARVDREETTRRIRTASAAWQGLVPVVTGFIGRSSAGRTTTLGRNGSDYTAALVAAALSASRLTIWTDVPGVLTADPELVPDAYPVPRLSHAEALELANLGLPMFHPRTMIPIAESGITLTIRQTGRPDQAGTRIDTAGAPGQDRPACIVSLESLALLELDADRTRAGALAGLAPALEQAGIRPRLFLLGPGASSASVVVARGERARVEVVASRSVAAPVRVSAREPVTLVTLLAEAMGRGANVAGRLFHAIGGIGVNVRAISQSASMRSISFVVDDADRFTAVRAVHAAFNLTHQEANLVVLGKGTVGGHLLDQILQQRAQLRDKDGILLNVVGIADSARELVAERGIALDGWRERFDQAAVTRGGGAAALLDLLARLPVPILVDCTAADGQQELYRQAFARGIHVVAANKKPLAASPADRDALLAEAHAHYRHYRYETTVGASLPVIGTLKDLVRTGDRVRRVEGSFSGTLGYLANELMAGVPLSKAVRSARERGFTEPHPRDDLAGTDAARKALILARELGRRVTLEQVRVEPFVDPALLAHDDVETFLRALEAHDARVSAWIEELKGSGRVLRYLATVDAAAERDEDVLRVGPVAVPAGHPSTRLRGSEAFVAFFTERYREHPLVVQGAGAGGSVTASGVLADVLAIAQSLRGA